MSRLKIFIYKPLLYAMIIYASSAIALTLLIIIALKLTDNESKIQKYAQSKNIRVNKVNRQFDFISKDGKNHGKKNIECYQYSIPANTQDHISWSLLHRCEVCYKNDNYWLKEYDSLPSEDLIMLIEKFVFEFLESYHEAELKDGWVSIYWDQTGSFDSVDRIHKYLREFQIASIAKAT